MIVNASALTKEYLMGSVRIAALNHIDFSVEKGEFVAIMGPSGSGKSTLLHLLGGLDDPTSGEIIVDGNSYADKNDDELAIFRRRHVGFVFQAFNLMPTLTTYENITLPLLIDNQRPSAYNAHIQQLLEIIGLADRATHTPSQMSGGQQQRVAIARALVRKPAILLADEPTGNLDSKSGETVLKLLRQTRDDEGQTIIMVTHSAHDAAFADRVVYLKDGGIVQHSDKRSTQDIHAIMQDLEV